MAKRTIYIPIEEETRFERHERALEQRGITLSSFVARVLVEDPESQPPDDESLSGEDVRRILGHMTWEEMFVRGTELHFSKRAMIGVGGVTRSVKEERATGRTERILCEAAAFLTCSEECWVVVDGHSESRSINLRHRLEDILIRINKPQLAARVATPGRVPGLRASQEGKVRDLSFMVFADHEPAEEFRSTPLFSVVVPRPFAD